MTLGGLALAVGILVDDATVEIENIHRNIGHATSRSCRRSSTARSRSPCRRSSRRCASASCSCRSSFITGRGEVALRAARDGGRVRDADVVLPLANARARRWCATCWAKRAASRGRTHGRRGSIGRRARGVRARLRAAPQRATAAGSRWACSSTGAVRRSAFARVRRRLARAASRCSGATSSRRSTPGQIKLHVRAPPGTRIEETEQRFARVEDVDPPGRARQRDRRRCSTTSASPYSGINLSLSEGVADLVGGRRDPASRSRRTTGRRAGYVRALRARPARSSSRTRRSSSSRRTSRRRCSTSGSPAPIDVQVVGADRQRGRDVRGRAGARRRGSRASPARSTCTSRRSPTRRSSASTSIARWRSKAGLTQRDVASDLLVSLSSSGAGLAELLARPEARRPVPGRRPDAAVRDRLDATRCARRRLSTRRGKPQLLGNVATLVAHRGRRRTSRTTTSRRTFDVQANVDGTRPRRGRGGRAQGRRRHAPRRLPRGTSRRVKGQVESMDASFGGLGCGLVFAVRARLPAHGRQLPVVARPVHHPDGAARARSRASSGCSS